MMVAYLEEAGEDRRELGRQLRAERDDPAAVRRERDPLDAKLRREGDDARLEALEAEAAANGWAVDKEALLYIHTLPPGHVHTRLTGDMRVYDAGCDGCTRYHQLNVDGRMIAPEITREEAAALLREGIAGNERPSGGERV